MTNKETLERVIAAIVQMEDDGRKYLNEYISKDVLITCVNTLGKQIPKKPFRHLEDGDEEWYDCPTCGRGLSLGFKKIIDHKYEYCKHCGQCIDWSDNNEE